MEKKVTDFFGWCSEGCGRKLEREPNPEFSDDYLCPSCYLRRRGLMPIRPPLDWAATIHANRGKVRWTVNSWLPSDGDGWDAADPAIESAARFILRSPGLMSSGEKRAVVAKVRSLGYRSLFAAGFPGVAFSEEVIL